MIRLNKSNRVQTELIAVYGTLRAGHASSIDLMAKFLWVGTYFLPNFILKELNQIPYAIPTNSNQDKIVVDIFSYQYRVDIQTVHNHLDYYEQVAKSLYDVILFDAKIPQYSRRFHNVKIYVAGEKAPIEKMTLVNSGNYFQPNAENQIHSTIQIKKR